jgi:4-carboxymuconolactone decarboxylase
MKLDGSASATLLFVLGVLVIGYVWSSLATPQSVAQRPRTLAEYNATLPKDVYPDSRSRIPIIKRETLDEAGKKAYDDRVSPNTTSLAGIQGPGGLRLHGSPEDKIGEGLGRRLQELARLVVAREMDQVFEWTVHEPVALREGLDPKIIDIIRHRRSPDGVPEKEASIIQLGREIYQKHKVSPDTFARALKQLGERDLIDLTTLMGDYTRTAILLHTVDIHLPYDREPLLPVP